MSSEKNMINPKPQIGNPKQAPNPNPSNFKHYDLEDRTLIFAKRVRQFVKTLPKTVTNQEDIKQLIRSSGSVGANYIEANNSLGKKDFIMHIRISKKEAKESRYWLSLLDTTCPKEFNAEKDWLIKESTELVNIFGAIIKKSE